MTAAGLRGRSGRDWGQSDAKDGPRGTGMQSALGVPGRSAGVPEVIRLWIGRALGSGWEKPGLQR